MKHREELHAILDDLIDTAERARNSDNEREQSALSEDASMRALDLLADAFKPELAIWLYDCGMSPIPDNDGPPQTDLARIHKSYAELVLRLASPLEAAKLHPLVVTRDLIEMSKPAGSSPQILRAPSRGRGQKDNRDLKRAAQVRVAQTVYFEAARTGRTIDETLERLMPLGSDPEGKKREARKDIWEKATRQLNDDQRAEARQKGKVSTEPHPDCDVFNKLWQTANQV